MNIFRKILHSVFLTTNFGLAIVLVICGNIHYFKPEHTSVLAFLGYAYPPLLLINILFICYWSIQLKPWVLISLMCIFLSWSSARAWVPINVKKEIASAKSISVLTYNVESLFHSVHGHTGAIHPVIKYIEGSDADIVCLQEAGPQFVEDLESNSKVRKALKSYPYVASGHQENRYSVILLSRYRILDFGRIEYVSLSNSSFWYDLKVGRDTIRIINNHLESNKLNSKEKNQYSDLIRKRESNHLTEVAEVLGSKVGNATVKRASEADSVYNCIHRNSLHRTIVCGDFNDVPGSYTYRRIRTGLKDAWVEKGSGWGHTFHEHFFLFRIDYILYSQDFQCIEIKRDKVDFSDHYPLQAKLELP
jgi:endonuclease/exonuclease/phosphatase family metal-dependent hydrolase